MMHSLRIFPAVSCGALLALSGCAQPDPTSISGGPDGTSQGTMIAGTSSPSGPGLAVAGDPEGVLMRNGVLYSVKDLKLTRVGTGRVSDGLIIERSGLVTVADGRQVRLRNGEMVTHAGEVIEAPPSLR